MLRRKKGLESKFTSSKVLGQNESKTSAMNEGTGITQLRVLYFALSKAASEGPLNFMKFNSNLLETFLIRKI